jgi:hypothetical protein
MPSSTNNVKLGVCTIEYGGVDLGYTKGGVEVEVGTETYKVMIDQFGNSPVKEYITARTCVVRAPLAETTLEVLNEIMPGASLVDNATKQVVTVVESSPSASTEYILTVNGTNYSFTPDGTPTQAEFADGFAAVINADGARAMDGSNVGNDLVLTARTSGLTYSVVEAAASTGTFDSITETTAAATGAKRVDVTTNVSADLKAIASTLKLHPIAAGSDLNEDFIIPLAATGGALQYSYKLDEERIYSVEFNAYPDDSQNGLLFRIGDESAA